MPESGFVRQGVRQRVRRVAIDEGSDRFRLDGDGLPTIQPQFAISQGHPTHPLYLDALRTVLKRLLPPDFFSHCIKSDTLEARRHKLNAELPLISISSYAAPPFYLSFLLLYKHRMNAFKFIQHACGLVGSWQTPVRVAILCDGLSVSRTFPRLVQRIRDRRSG